MSREGQDLMDVNGDSLAVEGMRTMQGETIPPVQTEFGDDGTGEPVFLPKCNARAACLCRHYRETHTGNKATKSETRLQDQPGRKRNKRLHNNGQRSIPPFLPQTLHTLPCGTPSLSL